MTNNPIYSAALKAAADVFDRISQEPPCTPDHPFDRVKAELAALPIPDLAGMVRKLEWEPFVFCGQDAFSAESECGSWTVIQYSGRDGNWAFTDPLGDDSEDDWADPDTAKAAAQADYAARILAGLEMGDGK